MGVIPAPSVVASAVASAAELHGVTPADILGRRRTKHIAAARHDAIVSVWTRGEGRYSLKSIGRAFNRDHTTVLHHIWRASPHVAP